MQGICRFTFKKPMNTTELETKLALAIVVAECTFGQARVRLEAAYLISKEPVEVLIDVSSEVGQFVARLFTGLMIRKYGEDSFTMEKVRERDRIFGRSSNEAGKDVGGQAAQG